MPSTPNPFVPKSSATGIHWPALPNPTNALLLALQYQLEQSQWWTPAQLQTHQLQQLQSLIDHAKQTVPFYQQTLQTIPDLEVHPLTLETFATLPLLQRDDLQSQNKPFRSTALPKDHLPVNAARTSGSTGKPVDILNTQITELFYRALNLRNHLWHRRNILSKLAVIRIQTRTAQPNPPTQSEWVEAFPSGPALEFDSGQPIRAQFDWLQQQQPDYLLTYPSNLRALVQHSQAQKIPLLTLRGLSTFGELVTPELRQLARETWGLPIIDVYSSKEAGIIALQCPEHDRYHIQSESVLVEVLDDSNQPCQPGEIGRVVLTPLHNYATPLIRYDIGDYAEVGCSCPCGRGLPVLNRIYGRQRNMMVLPSGEKQWPGFILSAWAKLGPIQQMQAIQQSLTQIEIKIVVTRPLTEDETEQLHHKIAGDFGDWFEISFRFVKDISRSTGGKYEDFICKVDESVMS
jgi:phenylacetate-CoA ligase